MSGKPRSYSHGFTLVELVVTMAVLSLLAFAVMPSVADWIRSTRVRNAAEAVQNGLQKARTEALRQNKNVTFWLVSLADDRVIDNSCALSDVAASWVISLTTPQGSCASAPSETVAPMIIETHAAGDGGRNVTVLSVDAGGNSASSVTFNGFGQVVAPGTGGAAPVAAIDLTSSSGGRRLRIQISSGGGVRLCDRAVAANDPRTCVAAN